MLRILRRGEVRDTPKKKGGCRETVSQPWGGRRGE